MRGKARVDVHPPLHRRFIPAHAGNSSSSARIPTPITVHPRACGEQCRTGATRVLGAGSSPRMRGTGWPPKSPARRSRFIPAHAGNSPIRLFPIRKIAVHPRACGEQLRLDRCAVLQHGSSPRMRGTDPISRPSPRIIRFIPAHAGNRPASHSSGTTGAVHPRACGEQSPRMPANFGLPGSSPRMRGTAKPRPGGDR